MTFSLLLINLICSEPKAKETIGLQTFTKKWQIIVMVIMIVLVCTAIGLSIYAVVASKMVLAMTTITPTTTTTSNRPFGEIQKFV